MPQTSNFNAEMDASGSRRGASTDPSGANCMSICKMNKGKSISLNFKKGHVPLVDDSFFEKYPVSELDIDGEELLLRPNWNINVNDCTIYPSVCFEVLDHKVLPPSRHSFSVADLVFWVDGIFLGGIDAGNALFSSLFFSYHLISPSSTLFFSF